MAGHYFQEKPLFQYELEADRWRNHRVSHDQDVMPNPENLKQLLPFTQLVDFSKQITSQKDTITMQYGHLYHTPTLFSFRKTFFVQDSLTSNTGELYEVLSSHDFVQHLTIHPQDETAVITALREEAGQILLPQLVTTSAESYHDAQQNNSLEKLAMAVENALFTITGAHQLRAISEFMTEYQQPKNIANTELWEELHSILQTNFTSLNKPFTSWDEVVTHVQQITHLSLP